MVKSEAWAVPPTTNLVLRGLGLDHHINQWPRITLCSQFNYDIH